MEILDYVIEKWRNERPKFLQVTRYQEFVKFYFLSENNLKVLPILTKGPSCDSDFNSGEIVLLDSLQGTSSPQVETLCSGSEMFGTHEASWCSNSEFTESMQVMLMWGKSWRRQASHSCKASIGWSLAPYPRTEEETNKAGLAPVSIALHIAVQCSTVQAASRYYTPTET